MVFTTYLSLITGESRRNVLYRWMKTIHGKENDEVENNDKKKKKIFWKDGRPEIKNPLLEKMKEWLTMAPTEKNIKDNKSHFIKIYYKILQTFEKYPNRKWIRKFNLLPTSGGYVMNNMEITHEGLMDMIGYSLNWTKEAVYKKYPDKDKLWCRLFHINQYETRNRRLAYAFYTDG